MNGGGGSGEPCIASMVDYGSVESKRLYMARRTVVEMLIDRGYMVANAEVELSRTLSDFRAVFGEKPEVDQLRLIAGRASNPSRKILVLFSENIEIRKKNMVYLLSQIMNKEMLDKVILILQNKMNSYARKVADEHSVKVEIFPISDLLVNITKHVHMPKHEILTAEEKLQLLKKYAVENKQLPIMLENDAISRYYGLVKGQIVKVSYGGGGVIPDAMVTYRCVG
ncbi:DNA-directed RNA polymerase V subunit 5C [Forsythia ovata]|uniref:DNA-directed RNA polymerase V subunit 5C n=1 Tax=Forsythia ovata TaxID=205694 RepID=A0ABD1QQ94_9LAMI